MRNKKKNKHNTTKRRRQQMQQSSNPNSTGSVDNSSQSNVTPDAKTVGKENPNAQEIIINSMITTKDVRDSLWRCRDFELSHLWQRSIFLTTILLLCFTGYGIVTMKLFDNIEYVVGPSAYTLNNIALVLCLVNIVFSCLWIMMAKGSKAWYERYENAIDAFENNIAYVNDDVINDDKGVSKPVGGFRYPNLKDYNNPEIKDCIFSCKGGAYSPSKINIAIGQISFIIWCLAFGVHYYLSTHKFLLDETLIMENIPSLLLILFIIVLVVIFASIWFSDLWMKSSTLEKEKYSTALFPIIKKIRDRMKGKKTNPA